MALAWFFIRLARSSFGTPVRLPGFLKSGGALGAVLLACVAAAPHSARAESTPDPALLNELRDRLTQAPPCAPTCAEIMQAQVHVSADRGLRLHDLGARRGDRKSTRLNSRH